MTTMSIGEASQALPNLLHEVELQPVMICDGEREVAVLVAPDAWSEKALKLVRLEQSRERVVKELTAKLEAANIRYVDFVDEILNDI